VIAVTVAVCGVLAADTIRDGLGKLPKGLLQLSGAKRVDAQITGVFLLVGGMIVGANTGAALRHGLIAGLAVGAAIIGLTVFHPEGPPPGVDYVMNGIGVADSGQQGATAVGGLAFAVMLASAWLGGQLFPPLLRKKQRLPVY
jgi:hypothetical protein